MRAAWAVVPGGEDRRAVAWGLLRGMLSPGVQLSNPCPLCGGPHGPVRVVDGVSELVGVAYARSRTAGTVVAVVGVAPAGVRSFAIDAEFADDPARDAAGAPLGFSVVDWVRVEAVLKADGRGVRVDPAVVEVQGAPDAWTAQIEGDDVAYVGRDLDVSADAAADPTVPGLIVSAAWR